MEPVDNSKDAMEIKAESLRECLNTLNPKNADKETIQPVTRLNGTQIITLTNAFSLSAIYDRYGVTNDIPEWAMNFYRQQISHKGEGRKEALEATKHISDAQREISQPNRVMGLLRRGF